MWAKYYYVVLTEIRTDKQRPSNLCYVPLNDRVRSILSFALCGAMRDLRTLPTLREFLNGRSRMSNLWCYKKLFGFLDHRRQYRPYPTIAAHNATASFGESGVR